MLLGLCKLSAGSSTCRVLSPEVSSMVIKTPRSRSARALKPHWECVLTKRRWFPQGSDCLQTNGQPNLRCRSRKAEESAERKCIWASSDPILVGTFLQPQIYFKFSIYCAGLNWGSWGAGALLVLLCLWPEQWLPTSGAVVSQVVVVRLDTAAPHVSVAVFHSVLLYFSQAFIRSVCVTNVWQRSR